MLNMKLLRSILQLSDFKVLEAENAEDGIQLAHERKPDMILMDIQLPGMDGFEATKLISDDAELKKIPIIAVSSLAMESDKELALEVGCDDYLIKPIDNEVFYSTINNYISIK